MTICSEEERTNARGTLEDREQDCDLSSFEECSLAFHHLLVESDEINRLRRPHVTRDANSGHLRTEAGAGADTLNNASDIRTNIELFELARVAHVPGHERVIVDDHVLVRLLGRALEPVGSTTEQAAPQRVRDELQQRQDPDRPQGR